MKICAAQTKPVKGDIRSNIANHLKLVDAAVSMGAGMIVFPELSITGYEPAMAKKLAVTKDDSRLDVFQTTSDEKKIIICIGAPLQNETGINISMIIFHPGKQRQVYYKEYLHKDELPFFVSEKNDSVLLDGHNNIAFAICYELSVPAHAEKACNSGAGIYMASVVKSVPGVEKAIGKLSAIASEYSMMVLMANTAGYNDGYECGGKSSIWNKKGELLSQLNGSSEGLLLIDTDTMEITQRIL